MNPLNPQEIRALNAEYLGAYLYGMTNDSARRKLTPEQWREESRCLFIESVDLLDRAQTITTEESNTLRSLAENPKSHPTKEDAKQNVRDILHTSKSEVAWLGNV